MEGEALVYASLESMLASFKDFWNYLSKAGMQERHLVDKVLGKVLKELPPKLSSRIHGYPGIRERDVVQTDMEIISDLVLEDVIRDENIERQFLEECYCNSGALSNYALVSRDILNTRYKYLFQDNDQKAQLEPVASKKGLNSNLMDVIANSVSRRPILLVGDVGAGKSTFVANLLRVEAPAEFEKSITLKVDLGSQAIVTNDIKASILDELARQLKENFDIDIQDDDFVRHCYYVDLEVFKKSVHVKRLYEIDPLGALHKEIAFLGEKTDNKGEHLKYALKYISRSQHKQVVIFIDNCDQRNDSDQETAFLVSQEIATNWSMIVFLALRPETFHRAKQFTGALSGYHTKAFTIAPPRVSEVITKRLRFAQKITRGEIQLSNFKLNVTFSKLDSLIDVLLTSLENDSKLYELIDNIANGNIRKSIEMVKDFFGSSYTNTRKILESVAAKGYYSVKTHEFLRTIIYGSNIHYNPSASRIANIFDVRHYDPKEHFLMPILLGLLHSSLVNNRQDGFIDTATVYSAIQAFGFTPEQIDSVIDSAYTKDMLETSEKGSRLLHDAPLKLRITPLGAYHVKRLPSTFTYVDAIIADTPVFARDASWNRTVYTFSEKVSRVTAFKEYLDAEWEKMNTNGNYFNWKTVSAELAAEMQWVTGAPSR
ncbi:hypothetical protein GCM10023172_23360 [Hymenobacter ginsengisoli]|uniref:NACHT domain-containing protein n=1 Tax=Hymenobacter ginsengisoli TaxID=1051626 RepID=A0ABP8QF26_9BACT